jgi:hypothetical protein
LQSWSVLLFSVVLLKTKKLDVVVLLKTKKLDVGVLLKAEKLDACGSHDPPVAARKTPRMKVSAVELASPGSPPPEFAGA